MEKKVYERHIKNQKTHWWFSVRRELISKFIERYSRKKNLKILDYGCGSGTNIKSLTKFGMVYCYEKDKKTSKYLSAEYKKNNKVLVLKNIKDSIKYDYIMLADVLEHIRNDKAALESLRKLLKPYGQILITVPAYNFLFSKKDLILKHYRRYGYNQIKILVSKKFKILRISFFNTLLFLPIALITLILKYLKVDYIDDVENTPNKFINILLYSIFKIELFFLKYIDFPFGVSIIIVGEKKNHK